MMLSQQVYAQAALLAGQLDAQKTQLLQVLCGAACSSLASRLRDDITPEDGASYSFVYTPAWKHTLGTANT